MINDFPYLSSLGWKPLFLQSLAPAELNDHVIGRITEVERDLYLVQDGREEYPARLAGRLRHRIDDSGDVPTVGDWVVLDAREDAGPRMIQRMLPRFSALSRGGVGEGTADRQLLCANVDTVLIVSSLNRDFNLRRLERYTTLVLGAGVTPVVVLTKADLCADPDEHVEQVRSRLRIANVVALNTLADDARAALAQWWLAGDTLAVLGSSGVGKSTLINRLAGAALQSTQAVRAADARGRHTTTRRSLFRLPGDVCVIDTPGMRELKIAADDGAVETGFADIQAIIADCRFKDCTHQNEPGCAVQAALAEDRLSADRWRNYQRLLGEQRQQTRLTEAVHQRRDRAKAFAKMAKRAQRAKLRRKDY